MVNYTLNVPSGSTAGNILFTDIPNILDIYDDVDVSTAIKSTISFRVSGATSLPVTTDGQYTITFEGETISNVIDPANAINKNFYISKFSNGDYSTAASIARAFRNCATIAANWIVQNDGYLVSLEAKNPVATSIDTYFGDILSPNWDSKIIINYYDAQNVSNLTGSKVMLDIYKGDDDKYVTTLEKTCNLNEVAFNLSPIITTFAEYGKAVPFKFRISYLNQLGIYYTVNAMDDDMNYVSIGYMVNQGSKYLRNANAFTIAQNMSRGNAWNSRLSERGTIINNTLLYVYGEFIPLSFYRGNETNMLISIDYLDSAFNIIGSTERYWSEVNDELLVDMTIQLNETTEESIYLENAFYIDISYGYNVIRYNVIKPLYATEESQRIYWRNSYGGVSFFDMTGKKSETRNLELQTYKKNIYDYYTDDMNELEKIYENDVTYQVTLKSHLFEEDGKYIFNDLLQSSLVWTDVNNQRYAIILDSVSVDEVDASNNIYEATIKFRYSQKPSLI